MTMSISPQGEPSINRRSKASCKNNENHWALIEDLAPSMTTKVGMTQRELRSKNQLRNTSSPKRVHFINTISILSKEDKRRETRIIKPDTKDNNDDMIVKVEKESEESEDEKKEEKEEP
ncbi:hypothetical protein Tco_1127075 [Tanacetum coccineum]